MSRVLRSRAVELALNSGVWSLLARTLACVCGQHDPEPYVGRTEARHVLLVLLRAAQIGVSPRYDALLTETRERVDAYLATHGGPATDHERARVDAVVRPLEDQ